jgi:hypothetical protein
MTTDSRIALVYFAYLALAAWAAPRIRLRRRVEVSVAAVAMFVLICATVRVPAAIAAAWLLPVWMPIVWLLVGYWLPAGLWRGPMPRVEAWLLASDGWLRREPFARLHGAAAPRAWLRLLEAAYLLVHAMVPAGLAVLLTVRDTVGPARAAELFWIPTLLAGYSCYGTLPWLQTRPPRLVESAIDPPRASSTTRDDHAPGGREPGGRNPGERHDASAPAVRRWNLALLDRLGVRANTFPSGHAAVALVIALFVFHVAPRAGLPAAIRPAFALLAALIALATVLCRYHYTADTLLGLGVGLLAWIAARMLAS